MINLLIVYLIVINLIGLFTMGLDKRRAEAREWRVPERTLFLIALIGGAAGTYAGMRIYRHKTRHWTFVVGVPLLLLFNLAISALFFFFWETIWK